MYIPLNRLITNLKTTQNEFVYKDTLFPYDGYYWKSYDGKYFTGKNPNDLPSVEIILRSNSDISIDIENSNTTIFYNDPEIDLTFEYAPLKNIDITTVKLLPSQYYPTPTQDDYNLGVFSRYFVVKANENIYLEVNKDTYNKIHKILKYKKIRIRNPCLNNFQIFNMKAILIL